MLSPPRPSPGAQIGQMFDRKAAEWVKSQAGSGGESHRFRFVPFALEGGGLPSRRLRLTKPGEDIANELRQDVERVADVRHSSGV